MIKKIVFALIFLCCVFSLSAEVDLSIFSPAHNINLSNINGLYSKKTDDDYKDDAAYAKIATIEFSEDTIYVVIGPSVSNQWKFQGQSDPESLCPYGLVAVLVNDKGNKTEDPVYIGFTDNSITMTSEEREIDVYPRGQGANKNQYLDLYLIIPEMNNTLTADDYIGSFMITLKDESRSEIGEYQFNLTGYVDASNSIVSDNLINFSINVMPKANARSINLDDPQVHSNSEGLPIGTYDYEFYSNKEIDYGLRLFVSSSADPFSQNQEGFVLKKVGVPDEEIDENTSIKYHVSIDNGKTWFAGIINDVANSFHSFSGFSLIESEPYNTYEYSIQGDVLFKLNDDGWRAENLDSGFYTSNIYFHVIALE